MITIWHNPRCSKSRQTLALIEASGQPFALRRYLEDAPSQAEIADAAQRLGLSPRALLRKTEKIYREKDLAKADDAQVLAAMSDHPVLIERPIVMSPSGAVVGRPPERVKEIL